MLVKGFLYSGKGGDTTYQQKQMFLLIGLFIVNPFISLLYALYHYDQKFSRVIFVLFTTLYGFSMIAESSGMDLFRYKLILLEYKEYSLSDSFNVFIKSFSSADKDSKVDLYVAVVGSIVSKFTSSGSVFMGFFGLVYGYVFVKSINLFIQKQPARNIYSAIIILSAAFMMPLGQLAGVRYCTATYLFFFGAVMYLKTNNLKYWFPILISYLVHFSFLFPVALFVGLLFVLKFTNNKFVLPLYILYISSFFLPDLISHFISNNASIAGESLSDRASIYNDADVNKEDVKAYFETMAWYMKYSVRLVYWYSCSALLILKFPYFKLKFSIETNKIYYLVLLLMSFTNMSMSVSNLGIRLRVVTLLYFFYFMICVYNENSSNFRFERIIKLGFLFTLLKIVVEIRYTIEYTTLTFYIGNLVSILIDNSTVSLWTLINSII